MQTWRDHVALDLGAALAGAVVFLPVPRDPDSVRALLTASAAVEAMLVALVTFSLTFMYQSASPELTRVRATQGKQLRSSWRWCIGVVLVATVLTLAGIWLATTIPAWVGGAGVGAFAVALASTVRALDFFAYSARASDAAQKATGALGTPDARDAGA